MFAAYAVVMVALSCYVVLDTFAIQRTYAHASTQGVLQDDVDKETGATVRVDTQEYLGTSVYVAHVYADDVHALRAAFADDAYGHNVSDVTSSIAQDNGALLAVNGDCYGMRTSGYVVRDGVLYRSESSGADQEDLVIYADGRFDVVREGETSAQELVDAGAWQVLSFGPGLVEDGALLVDADDEVGRAKASNPRTAIGKVEDGHYVLVVSDGRTNESEGLSLAELATFMQQELGVTCAYNLDGGGSSTMVYEGSVVNQPTSNGRTIKERGVTDIVYVSR